MQEESSKQVSEIYDKLARQAHWIAVRITKNNALAEEAIQNACLVILKQGESICGGHEAMQNYFLKAVRNCAHDVMRIEKRLHKRENASVARDIRFNGKGDLELDAEKNELGCAARSALDLLPVEEREAICLCCEQGLSLSVAAGIIGINKMKLSRRVNRGLAKLRKILARQGYAAAAPMALSAALGSLALPQAPATLTAMLHAFAANYSCAVASVATTGSVAGSTMKVAAGWWWTTKTTVGAALLAGAAVVGVAFVNNRNVDEKKSCEVIVADDFSGTVLNSFWEKSGPLETMEFKALEGKGGLRLLPGAELISQSISLDDCALHVHLSGRNLGVLTFELLDDHDVQILSVRMWRKAQGKYFKNLEFGPTMNEPPVSMPTLRLAMEIYVSAEGEIVICDSDTRELGKFQNVIAVKSATAIPSLKIRLVPDASNSPQVQCRIDCMKILRLAKRPDWAPTAPFRKYMNEAD